MTDCWATTIHAIDELEHARTPHAGWAAMATIAGAYGFTAVAAFRLDEEGAHDVLYANAPSEVVEAFRHMTGPLAASSFAAQHAIAAGDVQLTPQQAQLVAAAKKAFAAAQVLLVAIKAAGGEKGFVVLAGHDAVLIPIVRSSLHLLAEIAFAHGLELESKSVRRDAGLLSPRETECLRLSARGKTDVQIGRVLGISPRTARFHIENVKKKLGVATRVQAVAEALRLKAIAA